jgi:small subunit ribosomal protein S9e
MLPEGDTQRIFEGAALLRRLTRLGVLDEEHQKLDYVLSLTPSDFVDRRLQTQVCRKALAKSLHQSRSFIFQRHIAVGDQLVNQPAFLVWKDSESAIKLADSSVLSKDEPGRRRRIRAKAAKKPKQEDLED